MTIHGPTYHVDELRKFELDPHSQSVAHVRYGPDEFVVVGQEVVIEPLRVRVGHGQCYQQHAPISFLFLAS